MISKTKNKKGIDFDIILITGEYYDDHPLSPAGVLARVLDAKGYNVGIIEKPTLKEDFFSLGIPKLFFMVTSGSIDSMLNNYTPLKKERANDKFSLAERMPNRAVIFYCNKLREYFKGSKIIIGGIEASLRRFAHYDYWDNNLRKSILLDSRADILVYGNGEKQVLEIAEKITNKENLLGILGTCILSKELPKNSANIGEFELLPSFAEVKNDKVAFCKMQTLFSVEKNLAQFYDNNYVLQFKYPSYTSKDLDWIFSLPFSRKLNSHSFLKMAKWSIVTHRGCLGKCNFCSIALHQGARIISRSEENILAELKSIVNNPEFKGIIDDFGGPSANMYGMDFDATGKIDLSHKRLIALMKKARAIPQIKKIFVRSGVRYDFALHSKEYIKELSEHHVSGCLKIAPEHISEEVLALMNKNTKKLEAFVDYFNLINKEKKQHIEYYFLIGHPGESVESVHNLKRKMKNLNAEAFQLFTPTPMTVSTCMYWTGLNPYSLEPIKVIYDYNTKKKIKEILLH